MSDVSGVTNFFATANEGFITTTSAQVNAGAAIVSLNSVSGLVNGSAFIGIIDPGDVTKQQTFTGIVDVSGSRITGVVWTRGTNVTHAASASVVDYVSGTGFNMMSAGMLKQHLQNGAHGNITTTSIANSGSYSQPSGTFSIPNTSLSQFALNNPYKFSAYGYNNTSLPANTWTKVMLESEEFDTNNNFDNITNWRYTIPVTGYYMISGYVRVSTAGYSSTVNSVAAIRVNNNEWQTSSSLIGSGDTRVIPQYNMSGFSKFNAGDYIDMWVFIGEGSRATTAGYQYTRLSGFLVSL